MRKQVEAIYENGVLRPLEPLTLNEHQRVTVTIAEAAEDPMTAYLDHEYLETVRKEVQRVEQIPSRSQILQITSRDPESWSEAVTAEREDRS